VLVSLDYDRTGTPVMNKDRNTELKNKYGIRGYPTVLVMTPDGEVFGKTGYRPGGAEPYIEHLDEMLKTGKKDLADVQKLTKALDRAKKGEDRDRALDAIITKLTSMGSDSPFIGQLADVVSRVYPTAEGERRQACVAALVNAGRVDAEILAAAKEIDPDGKKGIWIKAVVAMVQGRPNSKEEGATNAGIIEEFFASAKTVPNENGAFLCYIMCQLKFYFEDDEAAAVLWAEKGLTYDPPTGRMRKFLEDMLEE